MLACVARGVLTWLLTCRAGLPREEAKDAIFWDVFEVRNPVTGERAEPWVPCEAAAAKSQKFVLHKVRRCGDPADEPCQFTMRFRCARTPSSLCRRVPHSFSCWVLLLRAAASDLLPSRCWIQFLTLLTPNIR